jgi:hypothetical protein
MNFLESLVLNIVIVLLASFIIWFRLKLYLSSSGKLELENKKREAFKNLLVLHSDLILGKHIDSKVMIPWLEKFSEMTINILLWGSDKVIGEYGKYVKLRSVHETKISDREVHFANAVLAFRKEIGYKNRNNKITPEHIILIFRIGYDREI